jgi:hypothetical protein
MRVCVCVLGAKDHILVTRLESLTCKNPPQATLLPDPFSAPPSDRAISTVVRDSLIINLCVRFSPSKVSSLHHLQALKRRLKSNFNQVAESKGNLLSPTHLSSVLRRIQARIDSIKVDQQFKLFFSID